MLQAKPSGESLRLPTRPWAELFQRFPFSPLVVFLPYFMNPTKRVAFPTFTHREPLFVFFLHDPAAPGQRGLQIPRCPNKDASAVDSMQYRAGEIGRAHV